MKNPLQQVFPTATARSGPSGMLSWPNDSADRGYTIFFTGRCGSTELVDILAQSGMCGNPDEYFNEEFVPYHNAEWQSQSISEYIATLVKNRSTGRVFGFKIDGFRHRRLCELVDPMWYFPKTAFKFIYMNRRNFLEQAYSYAHAKQTGVWHITRDVASRPDLESMQVEISNESIWRELALILEQEFYFERYFTENSLDVLRIDYEMLCASKTLLAADVMLTIGCTPADVVACMGSLNENFRKLQYDQQKSQRLINFRDSFGSQLDHLVAYRGRLPYASLRQYIRMNTGIDVTAS